MSTLKSNNENMTINADGASSEVKFQANGVEKASISAAGAFTSTTIDATKLTGNLPAIDGSSLTNLPAGGKVLQVVQSTSSGDQSTSSTSYVDGPLSVAITPSSNTSKVLITFDIQTVNSSTVSWVDFRMLRNSTVIRTLGQLKDAGQSNWSVGAGNVYFSFLDSPATTSEVTYKFQWKVYSGALYATNGTYVALAQEIGA